MSPIQTHETEEIQGIVDADVDPAAAIAESKVAHAGSGGHDHDATGTPTPAVLIVRQLRPTASGPADFLVNIAASNGVGFPDGRTVAVAATAVDFAAPLPSAGQQRIDLIYLDRSGAVQRALGTPTVGTPVPPAHDGIFPIAEVGPLASTTTSIPSGLIKDVRPFLSSGPLVRVKQGSTDLGFAHTLVAGTNVTAAVVAGVATLSASGGAGSPANATTLAVGVVRISANPVSGDPVALAENDARVALIASAIQADGSVAMTADLNLGGNDLANVGALLFAGTGLIQAGANTNLNLTTTGTGKVRIISPSALQLPSLTTPTTPNVGDIWFDPTRDTTMIRTAGAGDVALSTVQTGVLGLMVTEIVGDPTNPPVNGLVGDVPTLDFQKSLAVDQGIRFAFPVPADALLVEDVNVRLVFCMASAGSGDVALGYEYTVVPVNGDLTPGVQTGVGTIVLTPSTSAEVHQQNEALTIPFSQLSTGASVSVRLRRRSTDGADTRAGAFQLLYIEVLYAKKDIASERNVIEVLDEVTSLGQFAKLRFRGNLISALSESADTAVIDITDPGTLPATTSTTGVVRISPAPTSPSTPTAVGINATFLPVQTEKDAMAGTAGTPSGTNRYVTDIDARLPAQGENDALTGSFGTPGSGNRFVTSTDPRIPTQGENDALVGTTGAGPSGSNPYVLADYANLPSAGEKAAAAGSFGTPGAGNRYLTATDPNVILRDGSRAFTSPQIGVTPTLPGHLVTKSYADSLLSTLSGDYAGHVQNLTQLSAVPSSQRTDKQLRLVEDEGAIYRFDIQGTGGGVAPNEGLGQWYKVQAATQSFLIRDEGIDQGLVTILDFVGGVVSATVAGGVATINVAGGGGGSLNVKDGGATIVSAATDLNFDGTAFAVTQSPAGQANVAAVFSNLSGTFCQGNDARLADARTPLSHAASHQDGGADEIDLTGLSGRSVTSQFITIQDEGASQGQAHTLNVVGATGAIAVSSGVATLTLSGGGGGTVSVKDGVTTVVATLSTLAFDGPSFAVTEAPSGQANVAPVFGTTTGLFADGGDARFPAAGEKSALAGTNGTPGAGNRYVTDSDPRNTNARTPTAHKVSHQAGGSDEIDLTGLSGRAATSQFITIQDEGSSQGQAHTLNVVGAAGSMSVAAGVATLVISGGGGSLTVKKDGVVTVSTASVLDLQGFDVTEAPSGEANVSMPEATDSRAGLLPALTVIKIDSIEVGAQVNPAIQEEGTELGIATKAINFVGPRLTASFNPGTYVATVTLDASVLGGALTAGRVPVATNSTTLTDDPAFTFDTVTDTLTAANMVASSTFKASNLTPGRVVFSTTAGQLVDDADLTFAGDTLTATKLSTTQINDSGLTAGRVLIAGASGLITDDGGMTYNSGTDTLTVVNVVASTTLSASNLTAGRVVISGTGGLLDTDAALTYDSTNDVLTTGTFVATANIRLQTLTDGRLLFSAASGHLSDDADLTWNSTTNVLTVNGSIDLNNNQLVEAKLENLSAAPSAGNTGRIFIRTDTSPRKVQFDDGSTIQDITSGSDHNATAGKQGGTTGEFFHLTSAHHSGLTGGGSTALHTHDHGALGGLGDDDHTIYIKADGTRAFSGDQSMGGNRITSLGTPSAGTDAANKDYVDNTIASSGQDVTLKEIATSDSTVTANTTSNQLQTSISGLTPPGGWGVGKGVRGYMFLEVQNQSGTDVNLNMDIGGTGINGGRIWTSGGVHYTVIEVTLICRSTGVSGTASVTAKTSNSDNNNSVGAPVLITFNTSNPIAIDYNVAFSVADTISTVDVKNAWHEYFQV